MFCAKINAVCPHRVFVDTNFVFVLMPFKNSESIFDSIKLAVEGIEKKKFTCERADVKYTSSDIWCQKICRSIRRAKYLIVDTTGLNANVFYELGFAHALGHTKNIIITQSIEELPFDVSGFRAIEYTYKNFPQLREDLQKAILDLETEQSPEIEKEQSPEEMIQEIREQLKEEEKRSDKFKKEACESEKREQELKKRISDLKAIEKNPEEETEKLIAGKEKEIFELQKELSHIDKKKKEEMNLLQKRLEEEQQRRQKLEEELKKFKQTGDAEKLTQTTSRAKKKDWQTEQFDRGKKLTDKGKFEEAITIFTQLIDNAPKHQSAYFYRAFCLYELKDFDGAVGNYTNAIELDPTDSYAFNNRGIAYSELKDFNRAIEDFTKANELDPKDIAVRENLTGTLIISGKADEAEKSAQATINIAQSIHFIIHKNNPIITPSGEHIMIVIFIP